jgi:hypothetical protein
LDGVKYIIGPQWLNEVQAVERLRSRTRLPVDTVDLLAAARAKLILPWAEPVSEMEEFARYVFARHRSVVTFGYDANRGSP